MFDLAGSPRGTGDGIHLELDDAAFGRKLAAVQRYSALAAEATAAFEHYGADAFRAEFLRRAAPITLAAADYVPYASGSAPSASGRTVTRRFFDTALTYRPVIEAILRESVAAADALTHYPVH